MAPREQGLERFAVRDPLPRGAAIDRFLEPATARSALESGEAKDLGDFAAACYDDFAPSREERGIGVVMRRRGRVGDVTVELKKKICVEPSESVGVEYELTPEGRLAAAFTCEWNLAFLTGCGDYVRFRLPDGETFAGDARMSLGEVSLLRFEDDLRGAKMALAFDPPCTVWAYPLETASQSEGGLERVFQGTTVVAVWNLSLARDETVRLAMSLYPDQPGDTARD
jgi:hypothetical protein